jgi:hypothetical protein
MVEPFENGINKTDYRFLEMSIITRPKQTYYFCWQKKTHKEWISGRVEKDGIRLKSVKLFIPIIVKQSFQKRLLMKSKLLNFLRK